MKYQLEPESLAMLFDAIPHVVVLDGAINYVAPEVANELGCETQALRGPLEAIGTRLDDVSFEQLAKGEAPLRVRLGSELADRPVRLRMLGEVDGRTWIELRSLASEFRMESLLRRSGVGHMLLSPDIELLWSMSAADLSDVFPGDNPVNWIELMDPDDMQALGKAIYKVGRDPNLRRVIPHRLTADRTYTIIDTVESAMHDPDLRAVLVRSRLQDAADGESRGVAPYAGITVSDHMPIGVVVASTTGKVLHRNAIAAEFLGARAGQSVLPNETVSDDTWMLAKLSGNDAERFMVVFAGAAAPAGKAGHCTIPSPLDRARWLRVSVSPAAASTVVLTIEDSTELVEAEQALRSSNRLLEALDSHSEELVIVFDVEGLAKYTSSSVQRMLGDDANVKDLTDFFRYVHSADRTVVIETEQRVRSGGRSSGSVEFRIETHDRVGRWHQANLTNLLDDVDVQGLVLTVRNIHERYMAERELQFLATHDVLTTLPDRGGLRTHLEGVLVEAELCGQRTALIFCDIDNFKGINDRFGHHKGDEVLTEVAQRLSGALRSCDFVGRFGGDEFVVVIPNVEDEQHALALAARVFASATGPTKGEDADIDISVSMGIAVSTGLFTSVDELLQQADLAMYQSKRNGRGRVTLYSPNAPLTPETPASASSQR
jgi:diguanylate cyclase (GGDEF)-like protein/PAS domain S-box-containing protein